MITLIVITMMMIIHEFAVHVLSEWILVVLCCWLNTANCNELQWPWDNFSNFLKSSTLMTFLIGINCEHCMLHVQKLTDLCLIESCKFLLQGGWMQLSWWLLAYEVCKSRYSMHTIFLYWFYVYCIDSYVGTS